MTQLVGILNLTPDSFSDGGLITDAIARIDVMLQAGADVIDIGAESTRPAATPLSAEEEWQRLAPVLQQAVNAVHAAGKCVSLDSYHPETARKALSMGVDWINDVGGLHDTAMLAAVRGSECKLVLMHSLGVPANPAQHLPDECEPVSYLVDWFTRRIEELAEAGIAPGRLVIDPGIGFGKTARQSLQLVLEAERFIALGLPVLVGHSRKSFLSLFADVPAAQRDPLTLAFSAMLIQRGADYLRVHDVAAHKALLV